MNLRPQGILEEVVFYRRLFMEEEEEEGGRETSETKGINIAGAQWVLPGHIYTTGLWYEYSAGPNNRTSLHAITHTYVSCPA